MGDAGADKISAVSDDASDDLRTGTAFQAVWVFLKAEVGKV